MLISTIPAISKGRNPFKKYSNQEILELNVGAHSNWNDSNPFTMHFGLRYSFLGLEFGKQLAGADKITPNNTYSVYGQRFPLETVHRAKDYGAILGYIDINDCIAIKCRFGCSVQETPIFVRDIYTNKTSEYDRKSRTELVAGLGVNYTFFRQFVVSLDYDYSLGLGLSIGYDFILD